MNFGVVSKETIDEPPQPDVNDDGQGNLQESAASFREDGAPGVGVFSPSAAASGERTSSNLGVNDDGQGNLQESAASFREDGAPGVGVFSPSAAASGERTSSNLGVNDDGQGNLQESAASFREDGAPGVGVFSPSAAASGERTSSNLGVNDDGQGNLQESAASFREDGAPGVGVFSPSAAASGERTSSNLGGRGHAAPTKRLRESARAAGEAEGVEERDEGAGDRTTRFQEGTSVNRELPTNNQLFTQEPSTSFRSWDQGNPSLEDYGLASGNSETAVEATHDEGTMGACGGSVGSIMGGVGADAHAPSAPSNLVPDVPRPIPRTLSTPRHDQPENQQLIDEISRLIQNADRNALMQLDYPGRRNFSGITNGTLWYPYDDPEMESDSSQDIINDWLSYDGPDITHDQWALFPVHQTYEAGDDAPAPDIAPIRQNAALFPVHQTYEAGDDAPAPDIAPIRQNALQDEEQNPHTTTP
ncbi:uncharacterized protein [Penaeus vannamei]|uniref:uncharacterized protein n=1 Tax=Penaeus vannamei TaxID=6689 RepID=UPI00387F4B98